MPDFDLARKRLEALKHASFQPGTNWKRFVMDTPADAQLTERQVDYIAILAWKFRRQIPDGLVPREKPPNLPPITRQKHPPKEDLTPEEPRCEETLNLFEGT